MAGFNFSLSTTEVSNESYLRAWNVYDNVQFMGIEGPTEGVSKTSGNSWKKWDLVFKAKEGTYRESIFEPREGDDQRKEFDRQDGGKNLTPSTIETINLKLQQIISVYMNDTNKKKFQKLGAEGKFNNVEFKAFIKVISELLKDPKQPSVDYPIMIKLQGNANGYARLPYARISKDGDAWMERWLGSNLSLTPYEMEQAKKRREAKPTNMSSVDAIPAKEIKDDLDDLDSLVDSL